MEFKLTYEGELLGASKSNTRAAHKHQIRRKFHPQLKRLWEVTEFLGSRTVDRPDTPVGKKHCGAPEFQMPMSEWLGDQFERCGYRFCPLATEMMSLSCQLRILFLRPESPGQIVNSGDIDGRIKTIFDALKTPKKLDEMGGEPGPREGENPFYTLLEDDKLIANLSLETATLLQPIGDTFEVNDCRLVISVKLWPTRVAIGNMDFI
jgi:hypothetical protein